MNEQKVILIISALNNLAGRFTEMSHTKHKINGELVVMVRCEALEEMAEGFMSWAKVLTDEMLGGRDED